jgi:demethylmenaquinone methyltransferase/2-methoxy-6-polyprenyl-1,4-benzoquinol methylase
MAKKEGIRRLFNNIAGEYDKLNHILSPNIDKRWRKKAVRQIADTQEALKVLDVACGNGDFTIEIARKVGPGSTVTGIDLSEGMLEVARKKCDTVAQKQKTNKRKNRQLTDIDLVQGDCEAMPYEDDTFDRIGVGFGVRNFENLPKGLSEMFRVLKKDGKLVILELSIPSNPIIRWFYKLYFLKILPAVGGWISGNRGAYEYLPASVLQFPAPEKFMQMMTDAGFSEVQHKSFTFGICRMYIGKK